MIERAYEIPVYTEHCCFIKGYNVMEISETQCKDFFV